MKQLYGKFHYFDFTQYKGILDFNTQNRLTEIIKSTVKRGEMVTENELKTEIRYFKGKVSRKSSF